MRYLLTGTRPRSFPTSTHSHSPAQAQSDARAAMCHLLLEQVGEEEVPRLLPAALTGRPEAGAGWGAGGVASASGASSSSRSGMASSRSSGAASSSSIGAASLHASSASSLHASGVSSSHASGAAPGAPPRPLRWFRLAPRVDWSAAPGLCLWLQSVHGAAWRALGVAPSAVMELVGAGGDRGALGLARPAPGHALARDPHALSSHYRAPLPKGTPLGLYPGLLCNMDDVENMMQVS